jgi:hypothetical protein
VTFAGRNITDEQVIDSEGPARGVKSSAYGNRDIDGVMDGLEVNVQSADNATTTPLLAQMTVVVSFAILIQKSSGIAGSTVSSCSIIRFPFKSSHIYCKWQ